VSITLSSAVRAARMNAIRDAMNAGSGPAILRIYSGTRPASQGSPTGLLLAELTFSDPCSPVSTNGTLTMSAITPDGQANNSGAASWFRVVDSNNVVVMDGDIGTYYSDMSISNQNIIANQQVNCTQFNISDGNEAF